jgi:16S rRNA (cytidine1402-2'-O)-methyltransferase
MHEEVARGSLSTLAVQFSSAETARGEMVLIIDRTVISESAQNKSLASVGELVMEFEAQGLDHRAALKRAARELGLTRDETYRRLIAERAAK